MAAALSIISLVIFFVPSACACAHKTPGNSVPARPIAEHVFMKFRRCNISFLQMFLSSARHSTADWSVVALPTRDCGVGLCRGAAVSGLEVSPAMFLTPKSKDAALKGPLQKQRQEKASAEAKARKRISRTDA